ncbi:MAG: hypothetical protein OI74_10145 [Gammaproteobacteria bacterium (ex Lamellibrachia satsuma)]|nr:MAG: hypothetical protein HPY30_12845 [Gammaproteobacteria bacterium (ex Lamellibrachia satsuma)]RRS32781.1 MAG: hypothetical protein OI74_10145 [Gammaproteobacteria bacterium (ex Lamellibrachia satsuma)]RRS35690.1 MAG: hypothetical protein NV67_10010 [Gammaproteobacteria bacterium (ex Lamellibrachia satsuma)]
MLSIDEEKGVILLAHSHSDQHAAYALSEWLYKAWPDLYVYLTHCHFPELEELMERHYLSVIPHTDALLCLVSRNSLGSDAVSLELQVARKSSRPTILVLHPQMSPSDFLELQSVIEFWDDTYGEVIDTRDILGEQALVERLCRELNRSWPAFVPSGSLTAIVNKPRRLPGPTRMPVPDTEAIFTGRPSREQAEQWLAILLKGWDNRIRSRGLESGIDAMERLFSPESRAAQLLTSFPDWAWGSLMTQLHPLINDRFRTEIQVLLHAHQGNPEISRALAAILLLSAELE